MSREEILQDMRDMIALVPESIVINGGLRVVSITAYAEMRRRAAEVLALVEEGE